MKPSILQNHTLFTNSTLGGAERYWFGFNGKENITEVSGWQDYGERFYNTNIVRFFSPDPLIIYQQKYPWYSPYQFAGNTPVQAIDLDGLEELIVVRWFDGDEYKGETVFRIPTQWRDTDKKAGGDMMVIDRDVSERDDFNRDVTSTYEIGGLVSGLKDENGNFGERGYSSTRSVDYDRLNDEVKEKQEAAGDAGKYNYYAAIGRDPEVITVMFEFAEAEISEVDKERLSAIIGNNIGSGRTYQIIGISSPVADNQLTSEEKTTFNVNLAQKRANSVSEFIQSVGGGNVEVIDSKIDSSDIPDKDKQRVEITHKYNKID